jgi:hypothetical protein
MPLHENEQMVQKLGPTAAQSAASIRSGDRVSATLREAQRQLVKQQSHANAVDTADEIGIPQL